jgi:hypothetical protein
MYTWEKSDIEQWIRDHAVTRDGLSPQGEHETTEWFSEVDVRRLLADEREKIAANGPTDLEWTEGDTPGERGSYLIFYRLEGNLLPTIEQHGVSGYSMNFGWYAMKHGMTILRYARINTSKEREE